jgi:hypothetical protein
VTDALDRLAVAAGPLLRRVDSALAEAGATAADGVWPLLQKVRLLPSEAVATVAEWQAAPLAEATASLRSLARRYGDAVDGLPGQVPWEGAGAEAYGVRWASLREHLTGPGTDSVVGRLGGTAAYLDETAAWATRSRAAVAGALADVLGSAEAVALVTGLEAPGPSAARIAAHVLAPVAAACDEGRRLYDDWHARLAEVPFLPPAGGGLRDPAVLRVSD